MWARPSSFVKAFFGSLAEAQMVVAQGVQTPPKQMW
jgi:hypothetical protein